MRSEIVVRAHGAHDDNHDEPCVEMREVTRRGMMRWKPTEMGAVGSQKKELLTPPPNR
jgi:hypothetical protein